MSITPINLTFKIYLESIPFSPSSYSSTHYRISSELFKKKQTLLIFLLPTLLSILLSIFSPAASLSLVISKLNYDISLPKFLQNFSKIKDFFLKMSSRGFSSHLDQNTKVFPEVPQA